MGKNIAESSNRFGESNSREARRTRLFVAATVIVDGQVDPVRVRDMSAGGALIEGAVLPPPGTSAELVRAHLQVSARSMWVRGNRCGLEFGETVDVAAWMTRGSPTQQQRIDALFHRARSRKETARRERHRAPGAEKMIVQDPLATTIDLLAAMEAALVLDPHMQMNHPDQMRALQCALRLLREASEAPDLP